MDIAQILQAVSLFEKIEHILYQNPTIEVFKKWGVYMPAISINDELVGS